MMSRSRALWVVLGLVLLAVAIAVIAGEDKAQAEPIFVGPPQVLLEVHPNERGAGKPVVSRGPGVDFSQWPVAPDNNTYGLATYVFHGSQDLCIQVCAQNFSASQNNNAGGMAYQDRIRMEIDGIVPSDVWGIQSGPPGTDQWRGTTEQGQRYTLEFWVSGLQYGQHVLKFKGKQTPIIWWVKVYDLQLREPL